MSATTTAPAPVGHVRSVASPQPTDTTAFTLLSSCLRRYYIEAVASGVVVESVDAIGIIVISVMYHKWTFARWICRGVSTLASRHLVLPRMYVT